jgi:hypothetical protein
MAVRNDFTAGEVLAAADLNDTFASKLDLCGSRSRHNLIILTVLLLLVTVHVNHVFVAQRAAHIMGSYQITD